MQKIHFLHIGKTGGTAVKYALSSYSKNEKYEIILHGHETKLKDIPNGEKFFFFLRNPITRFTSGFYSRKRQGRPSITVHGLKKRKRYLLILKHQMI